MWTTSAEEDEAAKPKRFGEKETEKDDPKEIFKNAFQRERVGHYNRPSGIIRSDRNRSWKSHAQHLISTQDYWVTRTFSFMIGALDSNE